MIKLFNFIVRFFTITVDFVAQYMVVVTEVGSPSVLFAVEVQTHLSLMLI